MHISVPIRHKPFVVTCSCVHLWCVHGSTFEERSLLSAQQYIQDTSPGYIVSQRQSLQKQSSSRRRVTTPAETAIVYVRVLDVMHVCLQPFVLHLDRLASVGIYLHLIMESSPDPRLRAKAAAKARLMQADPIAAQMNCAAMLASNMSASVVCPEPSFTSTRGMKAYPKYPPSTAPTVASCLAEPRSPQTPQSDAPVRNQLIAALRKFVGQSPTPRPSTTSDLVAPWKRGMAEVDVTPPWKKEVDVTPPWKTQRGPSSQACKNPSEVACQARQVGKSRSGTRRLGTRRPGKIVATAVGVDKLGQNKIVATSVGVDKVDQKKVVVATVGMDTVDQKKVVVKAVGNGFTTVGDGVGRMATKFI